jgi:hypothetical protein
MSLFRTYLLTPEKVAQVFGVGKTPLRLIVFKHFAIVWESKSKPGAGE